MVSVNIYLGVEKRRNKTYQLDLTDRVELLNYSNISCFFNEPSCRRTFELIVNIVTRFGFPTDEPSGDVTSV